MNNTPNPSITPESLEQFTRAFEKACSAGTSMNPECWVEDNPTSGHCGLAACLVAERFGGEIVVVNFTGPNGNGGRHFFNILPDGKRFDATASQFGSLVTFDPPRSATNQELMDNTQKFLDGFGCAGSLKDWLVQKESFQKRLNTIRNKMSDVLPDKHQTVHMHGEKPDITRKGQTLTP